MSESKSSSGGVGFFGLLGLLFIGLKLTGVIDWSWWWVTAPLWGGFAVAAGLVLLAVVLAGAGTLIEDRRRKRLRDAAKRSLR